MPFIIAMYITLFICKAAGQVFFSEVYCWGRQTLGSSLDLPGVDWPGENSREEACVPEV